jgi:hypothetical protein
MIGTIAVNSFFNKLQTRCFYQGPSDANAQVSAKKVGTVNNIVAISMRKKTINAPVQALQLFVHKVVDGYLIFATLTCEHVSSDNGRGPVLYIDQVCRQRVYKEGLLVHFAAHVNTKTFRPAENAPFFEDTLV